MIHHPFDDQRWHPDGCECADCLPCAPRGLTLLDQISLQVIGGLGFGLLISFIIDGCLGWPVFG